MKTVFVTLVAMLVSVRAYGQGAIFFNNRITDVVDARVLLPDGSGVGEGWSAQLYAGAEGTAVADLTPLSPRTTFRLTSPLTRGYVNPLDVVVPGLPPGSQAVVVMRAFNGATYESSPLRGESPPITIVLGGDKYPPANMVGLQSFTVGNNLDVFAVTASAGANGTVSPAHATRVRGESLTIIAIPETNFTVDRWSVDGTVVQEGGITYTLTNIQVNHAVAVTFKVFSNGGGTVTFNNYIPGVVDARVRHPDGTGVGAGWTAQLYGGPEGTPTELLKPLSPTTTFRLSSESTFGYVNPVEVAVPGVSPSAKATLAMRVFQGANFETAGFRGESAPITIVVGGGVFTPANLAGLQSFKVNGPVFTITASAGAHGSISPSGTFSKFQGESQAFIAVPDANYTVDEWTVDGRPVQTGGTAFTFAKIQANASVAVSFKLASLDGLVVFSNYIPGLIDARVLLASGAGAGAGWTAQLYGGPEGTAVSDLKRLYPTTTFRTSSEATLGYVNAVDVSVPGVSPSRKAILVMRVYNGATYETSATKGESAPVTVTLGGGLLPAANLEGLQGFTLPAEPPPPTTAGTVTFNNRVPGEVEASVLLPDGSGAGLGYTAQLYGGPEGGQLVPLHPTTTFRTSSAAAYGYVEPVVISVNGLPPGARANLVMVAYLGASLESAVVYGQSKPITVTLGGGTLPPANLTGLTGFTVTSRIPVIVRQPLSQTARVGSSVTFNVVASGAEPLTYQWRFGGDAILGATSSSYTLSNVQLSQAGSYTVAVRNSYGVVTSASATLTVVSGSAKGDFNSDGLADLLFQNEDGFLAIWFMDGASMKSASLLTPNHVRDEQWRIVGAGNFNADAHEDILFQHKEGTLAVWHMEGTRLRSGAFLDPMDPGDEDWRVVGTGDFDQDGHVDLLFQHKDATLAVWYMDGLKVASGEFLKPDRTGDEEWRVAGAGDFNADGKVDLIFQHEDGSLAYWYLDGVKLIESGLLRPHDPRDKRWRVASVADLNHDGRPDLVFQHKGDGALAAWFMNGIQLSSAQLLRPSRPGGSWALVAP
ncbi:MAG: VCBS repeat-containing protein [Verrucomicrobia bacterium]|nr:VCBS repeat-containing protein [Verrucomicrobiota bacterium]